LANVARAVSWLSRDPDALKVKEFWELAFDLTTVMLLQASSARVANPRRNLGISEVNILIEQCLDPALHEICDLSVAFLHAQEADCSPAVFMSFGSVGHFACKRAQK
jgi:hypothetical protein